jgi:DNA invertase Pin-like site-specific DNA recombinase
MSIAAIYARKSNDQNLPDEEKSVTRQVERAHAYAARQGWVVPPEHVYTDDGISGAEFVKRPGFLALMNALKPRPPFQVLVTMRRAWAVRWTRCPSSCGASPMPGSACGHT